ncbi:MAG: transcription elongation factor GreA [Flavobacteriales bacterium]|jgi:transcription elongation factor GreA|tara:strand:+ start:6113 stop:6586 length:474 start_codon:yes stop_codon:yes gene_type:complete
MAETSYFTQEGLDKIRAELNHLKKVERPSVTVQIADARDKGDLSENAEYDAAKEAQGLLELRIAQMEEIVAYARVIDETKIDNSKVLILSKVKVKNLGNKVEMEYTLVSEEEADLAQKKISISSPIGKGILGKAVGDVTEIKVPAGLLKFEIINISR